MLGQGYIEHVKALKWGGTCQCGQKDVGTEISLDHVKSPGEILVSTGLEARAKVHQDEFLQCLLCREQISIGTGRQVRKQTLSKGKRTVTWPKRIVIKIK